MNSWELWIFDALTVASAYFLGRWHSGVKWKRIADEKRMFEDKLAKSIVRMEQESKPPTRNVKLRITRVRR